MLFASLYHMLARLSFFFTFSVLFLPLLIFSFENINPLHFQAGCRERRLNLAVIFCVCVVVHFFLLANPCFRCVRFSVFPYKANRLAWGKHLRNDMVCVEWDVKQQLNHSVRTRSKSNRLTGSTWLLRVTASDLSAYHRLQLIRSMYYWLVSSCVVQQPYMFCLCFFYSLKHVCNRQCICC